MFTNIKDVIITPQKIIPTSGGDVLRILKNDAVGFCGFAEAYFSKVKPGVIKAWKRHREMVLNVVVPVGHIRFVIYDDRPESPTMGCFQSVELSLNNYHRLTIPPLVWFGFKGYGKTESMLLNIASTIHTVEECDRKEIDAIAFNWSDE